MMREEKVTHSFRWVVLIHTCLSILLREHTHVHTQVHLKAGEYLGMLGPGSGFYRREWAHARKQHSEAHDSVH